MKLAIYYPGPSVSLSNVSLDIKHALEKCCKDKVSPFLVNQKKYAFELMKDYDAVITTIPLHPITAVEYLLTARDMSVRGFPNIVYTMVEGTIMKWHVKSWMIAEVKNYIAASNYTKQKLEEAGFNVRDVIYHGIDFEIVKKAKRYVKNFKEKLGTPDKVKFLYIATGERRKGHPEFAEVLRRVVSKTKDAIFYIITDTRGRMHYHKIENAIARGTFGKMERHEILAFIGAFDFYIHASLSEGFGLPLLEANAMGVPGIHLAYEPLTEFSDQKANIWVNYVDVVQYSTTYGIFFDMHVYDVNDMVDAILQAIDLVKNKRAIYSEMKQQASRNARKYDITKLYPRFLEYLS